MNNPHFLSFAVLLMAGTLAACASTSAPAPTATPSITVTDTNTPQPTATRRPTPTPIVYPMRLELVGQFGGIVDALALDKNRVYLQVGSRVVTVDVSSPYHPTELGQSDVPVDNIVLIDTSVDGHVLVKDIEETIWQFQAQPDGSLTLVHTYLKDDAARPEIDTDTGVIASAGDLSFEYDPDSLDMPSAQPLTVRKNGEEVLTAMSLPAGELAASRLIAARGRYVYIAVGYGLSIYDIGISPERPYIWSEMDGNRKTEWREVATLEKMNKQYIYGGMVPIQPYVEAFNGYLTAGTGVMSLSNPENPIKAVDAENAIFPCDDMSVKGGIVYPYMGQDGTYTFVDMSKQGQSIEYEIPTGLSGSIIRAAGRGLLFVATGYEYGRQDYTLVILNVDDPRNPKPVSSFPIQGYAEWDTYNLVGDYLYIDTSVDHERVIMNLSDPAKPQLVDQTISPTLEWFQPIMHGNWIIDLRSWHLLTYSLSDIFRPVSDIAIPGAITFIGQPTNPICFNDRLYVFAEDNTLFVFDFQDPAHPQWLAKLQLPSDWYVADIASYGDYLYMVGMYSEVRIYKLVPN